MRTNQSDKIINQFFKTNQLNHYIRSINSNQYFKSIKSKQWNQSDQSINKFVRSNQSDASIYWSDRIIFTDKNFFDFWIISKGEFARALSKDLIISQIERFHVLLLFLVGLKLSITAFKGIIMKIYILVFFPPRGKFES